MVPPIETKKYKKEALSPEQDKQRKERVKLSMRIYRHGDPTIVKKKQKTKTDSHKKRVFQIWYAKKKAAREAEYKRLGITPKAGRVLGSGKKKDIQNITPC